VEQLAAAAVLVPRNFAGDVVGEARSPGLRKFWRLSTDEERIKTTFDITFFTGRRGFTAP
jgi:hypothetical protein